MRPWSHNSPSQGSASIFTVTTSLSKCQAGAGTTLGLNMSCLSLSRRNCMERSPFGAFPTQQPKKLTNRLPGTRIPSPKCLSCDPSPALPGTCGGLPRAAVPSCMVTAGPELYRRWSLAMRSVKVIPLEAPWRPLTPR